MSPETTGGMTAAELVVRYSADTSDLARGSAQADSKVKGFAKGATSLGKKMTMGVTLPILGAAAGAVKLAMDFDKTMNTMEAVAGVSGKQRVAMEALAMQLGRDTVFSANDAGAAMLELAKAGLKPAQIQAGALKNTLSLASAGDLELADAAGIAANAMNTFGLSGSQSQVAVDALAGAANASSADVSDLAMALAMGGNAAATAGLNIQETSAALAALANEGIKGSDAGTSLKTMLLSLVPTTAKAKSTMKDLGVQFTNAKGQIKPLTGIAQELQDGMKGLSQAEQITALKTMFGTDAFRAANIIRKQGAEGIRELLVETSKEGTAADVAKGKMKGMAGALEAFKGSVETAGLTVGKLLLPMLTKLLNNVLIPLFNKFSALPGPVKMIIIAVLGVLAVLGPLLLMGGLLVGALAGITVAGLAAAGIGILIAAGIAIVVAALIYAYQKCSWFREMVRAVFGAIVTIIKNALSFVVNIVKMVMAIIRGDWGQAWQYFKKALSAAWGIIKGIFSAALHLVLGLLRGFLTMALGIVKGLAKGLWTLIKAAWGLAVNAVQAGVGAAVDHVKSLPGRFLAALGDLGSLLLGAGRALIEGFIQGIKNAAGAVADAAKSVAKNAIDGVKGMIGMGSPSKVFREIGREIPRGFALGIEQEARLAHRAVGSMLGAAGASARLGRPPQRLTGPVRGPHVSARPGGRGGGGGFTPPPAPSLAGVEVSGTLDTPWGPSEMRATIVSERNEDEEFSTVRDRMRRGK